MNYNIIISENFKKELKPLAKKFPSIKSDIQYLLDNIEKELALSTDLGGGFRKIKLKIKSKGKGSSGGGRIISHETIIAINETNLVFGSIYNKTDFDSINISILKKTLRL
ncbi:MAG TPA: addiction module toxin RelE [Flavobacterium sp.]|nr:addiction module toxin RelE [Flavobacterium sp.]HAT77120.1 addiction module toxin RelE [Flavobacterium sp.]HAT81412.1 addiction module toxin RelE [Flavobacterium sp.]